MPHHQGKNQIGVAGARRVDALQQLVDLGRRGIRLVLKHFTNDRRGFASSSRSIPKQPVQRPNRLRIGTQLCHELIPEARSRASGALLQPLHVADDVGRPAQACADLKLFRERIDELRTSCPISALGNTLGAGCSRRWAGLRGTIAAGR